MCGGLEQELTSLLRLPQPTSSRSAPSFSPSTSLPYARNSTLTGRAGQAGRRTHACSWRPMRAQLPPEASVVLCADSIPVDFISVLRSFVLRVSASCAPTDAARAQRCKPAHDGGGDQADHAGAADTRVIPTAACRTAEKRRSADANRCWPTARHAQGLVSTLLALKKRPVVRFAKKSAGAATLAIAVGDFLAVRSSSCHHFVFTCLPACLPACLPPSLPPPPTSPPPP
eukprot:SAG11_NODE_4435_length_1895_cov_4.584633_1_plen_228_part_10